MVLPLTISPNPRPRSNLAKKESSCQTRNQKRNPAAAKAATAANAEQIYYIKKKKKEVAEIKVVRALAQKSGKTCSRGLNVYVQKIEIESKSNC